MNGNEPRRALTSQSSAVRNSHPSRSARTTYKQSYTPIRACDATPTQRHVGIKDVLHSLITGLQCENHQFVKRSINPFHYQLREKPYLNFSLGVDVLRLLLGLLRNTVFWPARSCAASAPGSRPLSSARMSSYSILRPNTSTRRTLTNIFGDNRMNEQPLPR